jgi:hypothetical protein
MIVQFFRSIANAFKREGDPVFHCEVYRDKAKGGCAHVDGMLCDFPDCSIRQECLKEAQNVKN